MIIIELIRKTVPVATRIPLIPKFIFIKKFPEIIKSREIITIKTNLFCLPLETK